RQGECAADADAPDAQGGDIGDAETDVANDEKVEWFGVDRLHKRGDLFGLRGTRREENIGARFCVGFETAYRFAEGVGMADVVAPSSCGQEHLAARAIDRISRRPDALDSDRQLEERGCWFAGGILDRQPRDARRDTSSDALGYVGR